MASNVTTAWRFLRSKGLTPAQAAGVIGSMQGESGKDLNPAAVNPGPDHATGIAQWLGARKNAAVLTKQLGPQLNHLWSELQGPENAALKALKATHTPEAAAVAWQRVFERGAPFEQKYDMRAANARQVFNSLRGVSGGTDVLSGGSGVAAGPDSSPSGAPASGQSGIDPAALVSLLTQQQQRPVIQSAGIQAPSFAARAPTPGGYATPPSGGGPASAPDVTPLLAAIAGSVSQSSPDLSSVAGAPAGGASADVASPNTGPASEGRFGKSHSPLFELIHKGDRPYAVKNGQVVDKSVYSAVWDNHAGHVHVAAGPNTIVELGKLAQSMGLTVGANPYFTGHPETGGHVSDSYHYRTGKTRSGKIAGEAIDVSGDPQKMNRYAAEVERLYGLGR